MLTRSVHIFAIIACTATLVGAAEDYVAHEWGTFTSFQGSDGQVLEWRSLLSSELPKFVYDRTRPDELVRQTASPQISDKSYIPSRQRMETPVIYFYPKNEMVVDVSVRFPEGLITEWYPQVRDFNPPASSDLKSVQVKEGSLRWGKIRLFPEIDYPEMGKFIPEMTREGKNYFAARETDSAFVRVGTIAGPRSFEHEKFLFYRGVGNFKLPLEARSDEHGFVMLRNTGEEALAKLFILRVDDGRASYGSLDGLKAGETRTLELPNVKSTDTAQANLLTQQLGKEMETALIAQGLYPREAAAMVKTWQDSWFEEHGLRIFYLLPQAWTERVLPLSLEPAPAELKRVMVGRAELLTPDMEGDIAKQVAALSSIDFDAREKASAALQKLGRFTEPALKRVIDSSHDEEVKSRAKKLLAELSQPVVR